MPRTAIAAAAVAAVALTGCDLHTERLDYSVPRPIEIKKVVATVETGDIEVRTAPETASVAANTRWIAEEPEVTFRAVGDTLFVTAGCPIDEDPQCRVDLELTIPPDARLEIRGGETNVDVRGLAGALDVKVEEGDIVGDDLRSDEVTTSVADGATSLTFTGGAGDVAVVADYGDVHLVVPPTSYALDVQASGAQELGVDDADAAHRQISVQADHGDVVIRPQDVLLGAPFELKIGETVQVRDAGVSVRLDGVVEDSRCPAKVQCVWAGTVIAALTVSQTDGAEEGLKLELGKHEGVLDYELALHTVLPPRTGEEPPSDDLYALVLTLDPAR